ncbi:MAG TPA: lysylphosphatidylglycerol synthase transmembrane domain-containing protein [Acidimicrobiia bacterium]|nr:lysylphosphatidylglycerol synthase transmembrane domain-containing protein [Acidimicrobiia bacterium]
MTRPPGKRTPRTTALVWSGGLAFAVIAVRLIAGRVDGAALSRSVEAIPDTPGRATLVFAAFAGAFGLRALAWSRVLPGLRFRDATAALHVGLAANHVLPLRMGEAVRPVVAAHRAGVSMQATMASTVALRATDVGALLGLGWLAGPQVIGSQLGWLSWAAPAALAGSYAVGVRWLGRLPERRHGLVRLPDLVVLALTCTAWVLEAVLVWQSARWAGLSLSASGAMVVTAASVAAQVAGLAPGGVGTYEAAAVAAYVALGFAAGPALVAALIAHGLTTVYSLATGAVALGAPSLGRLARRRRPAEAAYPATNPATIL